MSSEKRELNEFKQKRLINEGAFGKVYLYEDQKLNRDVAIKVVDHKSSEKELENVQTLSEITIPCVVKFFGYFTEGPKLYIIMEYCQHGNLREVIESHAKKQARIDDEKIKQWSRELILVMIFMEENHIIHNDIKPENILLNEIKNSILLADVGEAQLVDKFKTLTKRGGTPQYMAPERSFGEDENSSTASDIWSCGVVFYELIYLMYPFKNFQQMLKKQGIHHDETEIGTLFKPIFEGIFIVDPEERFSPGKIRSLIMGEGTNQAKAQNMTEAELALAKYLKLAQANTSKISTSFPKIETECYVEFTDPKTIDKAFKLGSIVVLSGVGGAGKTTLAMEYAKRFSRKDDSVVVWMSADNASKIKETIQSILLKDLAFDKEKLSSMDDKSKIKAITSHVKAARIPHLFVFDNIGEDEMPTIELFSTSIPNNLKILLTSRNSGINKQFNISICVLQIDAVSLLQVKQYLVDRIRKRLSSVTVKKIFNEVFKPLAQITPFYMENVVASIVMYLDRNNGVDSGKWDEMIKQMKSVDISDYVLSNLEGNEECQRVLERFQFLDPDEISLDVLELLTESKDVTQQGVQILSKYQIVKAFYMNDKKYIKIHRLLVQSISNNKKLSIEKKNTIRRNIISHILKELENIDTVNQVNIIRVKQFQNHIFKMIEKENDVNENTFELYEKLIMIEEKYNYNYKSAIDLQEKLLKMIKKIYKDQRNHPEIATSLMNLGNSLKNIGNYSEAIKFHKESLEMRRKIYKDQPDHPSIANSLNNLGSACSSTGDFYEAINVYMELLEMRRRIYKDQPNHPDIANSLNNLGLAYGSTGNYSEAIKFHQESLEMYRRIYKDQPDHPAIATSLNNLGNAYYSTGNYSKAIKLYKESLEMYRRIYKDQPDHPAIAMSLNNLGNSLKSTRDYSKAIKFHLESLEMRRKIYKDQPNHPDIASSLNNLGLAYEGRGDYSEAINVYMESLEMIRKIYKDQPDHPAIAAVLMNLGNSLKSTRDYSKAIKFHQESLEMYRRIYKDQPDHPDIANSLNNLGSAYEGRGDYSEAINVYMESLEMIRKIYKDQPDHPAIAAVLMNLGNSLKSTRDYSKAIKFHQESLEMYRRIYKDQPDHPDIANSLNNLGSAYEGRGDYSEAINVYMESLEMIRKIYKDQPDHPDIANSLNILGSAYSSTGNYSEAIKLYKESLEMYRRIYKDQPDHLSIANSLNNLGSAY